MMSIQFKKAFDFAYDIHVNDFRKNGNAPYISHPMGVASMVFEGGGNENQAIAGLFHDILEDHYKIETVEEMGSRFGSDVLDIVCDCTDWVPDGGVKKPKWKKRKERYIYELLPNASDSSGLVITADKLYNARSIVGNLHVMGDKTWDIFSGKKEGTLWYYREISIALSKRYKGISILYELHRVIEKMISLS